MATGTEFCLLGPVLVRRDAELVQVQRGKQRAVLAALLLRAGQVVSLDELAEVLWGQEPPPSARVTIQNYVMRLRRALGDTDGSLITTRPPGYVIRVERGELDVARFEALLCAARGAARDGSWAAAATRSRAALELWRDEPLADVDSELLAVRDVPRLAELRLQALEVRIDADLRLGPPAEVIAELRQLVVSHPLRERLHALLMLALYRDGRQGEALAAYQAARRVLVHELGTEPGTGLRELHHQVLTADPGLEIPELARRAAGGAARVTPRELPAAVPHFTGRAAELAKLTGLLDQPGGQAPGMVVVSVVSGTAGVGKTALAVHWAHQVAARFPDGQLFVNLRGYDSGRPVRAADALAGLLRALGVHGHDIPSDDDERATRYRTLLAGRRMLILLDNARSAEQVRPLLPGTPACVTVVTSRDALAGLVARDGATVVDLDLLPSGDAIGLLRALIGPRVDDEPQAAAELADRCCRLPLALRVAAELAVTRRGCLLAGLAAELAHRQRRLDLLDAGGDPATAIRAVFSWSYRHLNAQVARAFGLLGVHPGHDIDRFATAALIDTTPEHAADVLGQLARAHLIQPARPDRYGMHDLLRAYARELAAARDTEEERRALTRLFDHYLHTAAAAMDTLFPEERHRRPAIPRRPPAQPVTDPGVARAWLDTERATLVAATAHAAAHGWPDHAAALAATVFRYLDAGGYYSEAITIHTCACRAAHRVGDRDAEATALTSLGLAELRQGSCQEAGQHLREALTQHRQTGNQGGQARTLTNLGFLDHLEGRYQQATGHLQQALALHRQTGDRSGEAGVLTNLGNLDERQGRYQQAAEHHQQALALCRETDNRAGEARALGNLGRVNIRLGRCDEAVGQLQQALVLCHQSGSRISQAYILVSLGEVGLRQGHPRQAAGHQRRALALFREAGDRPGEVEALNGLGEASVATGEPERARTEYIAALSLARQIGDKYEQARAHDGLAHSYRVAGDHARARLHWQQALALYSELCVPETEQVRARLISAGCSDRHE